MSNTEEAEAAAASLREEQCCVAAKLGAVESMLTERRQEIRRVTENLNSKSVNDKEGRDALTSKLNALSTDRSELERLHDALQHEQKQLLEAEQELSEAEVSQHTTVPESSAPEPPKDNAPPEP